jgi:hypothetical protein
VEHDVTSREDALQSILVELAEAAESDAACCRLLRRPRACFYDSAVDHLPRMGTSLDRLRAALTEGRRRIRELGGAAEAGLNEGRLAMDTVLRCADRAARGDIAESQLRAEIAGRLRQQASRLDASADYRAPGGARRTEWPG